MKSRLEFEMTTMEPSPTQDKIISIENVSVRYRIPTERIGTFKEYMIRTVQRRITHTNFWALKNVSFSVNRGEIFGIIGNNGAGKSTLMKLVARVFRPTEGRVWVRGRVAPLLELGAGFHPELTGRENIYLNGAILGFSRREMDAKFQRIVDFTELPGFIDAPLRTYSSGMQARLGFAVATDEKPEILLVDEILSVGDEAFQRNCLQRNEGYCNEGTSILIVSHSMTMIDQMCQRSAWLDHGQLRAYGNTADVIHAYRESQ